MKKTYKNTSDFRKIELYNFCVILITIKVLLDGTVIINVPEWFDSLILVISSTLLFLNYILKKYTVRSYIILGTITFMALYTSFRTGYYVILIAWLIMFGINMKNIKKTINCIYKTEVIFLLISSLISIVLYLTNINSDLFITIRRGAEFFNFGFAHVNLFTIIVSNIMFMWIWLNYKKMKKNHFMILLIISICVYFVTDTRTSFFIQLLTIFLAYISKINKHEKIVRKIAKVLFLLIGIAIFLLSYLYYKNNSIAIFFNDLVTGRIHFSSYALYNFGFTFGGVERHFNLVTWDSIWQLNGFTFDCLYSQLFFHLGFIWFIMIAYGIYKVVDKLDYISVVLLISWCLYGITETQVLYGVFGFQLFFLAMLFNKNKYIKSY